MPGRDFFWQDKKIFKIVSFKFEKQNQDISEGSDNMYMSAHIFISCQFNIGPFDL